jgi:adenosylhomocysteine nucleosidase
MLWYTTSFEKKDRRIAGSRVLAAAQKSLTTCSALGICTPLAATGPPTLPTIRHDDGVTKTTKRVAVLAPMRPELKAIVKSFGLNAAPSDAIFSHAGTVGAWWVGALVTGMGPASAREATHRALSAGSIDHVMVIGIAGGLDPALPVGSLLVPERVQLYPDGPVFGTHPIASRQAAGSLMTTDGLFDYDDVWQPILASGFGAVDMEAAGVAEVCEDAGVGWSVYRGISDRPDEHIVDQAVFSLSKPDGSADPVAVGKYLARDPRRAKALARLNKCMQHAARTAADAACTDLTES